MEVILDTNFIISCVMKGIDFFSQLEEQGFKVKVPHEVMDELKDLRLKVRRAERDAIELALEMFSRKGVKKMKLGHMRVDDGLVEKGKQGYYIATLDREIKRKVPKRVVIFDAQKRVGAE